MDTQGAFKSAMNMANFVCMAYLDDLSDEEMMHRPHPGANHIKWQLGHLIASEHQLTESVAPGSMPPLPEGFNDRYTKETAGSDDATQFDSKEDLVAACQQQRAGTIAALEKLSPADFDQPGPEQMRQFAPTVGDIFSLQSNHWMMHGGQWAVIRRQLGREPLF